MRLGWWFGGFFWAKIQKKRTFGAKRLSNIVCTFFCWSLRNSPISSLKYSFTSIGAIISLNWEVLQKGAYYSSQVSRRRPSDWLHRRDWYILSVFCLVLFEKNKFVFLCHPHGQVLLLVDIRRDITWLMFLHSKSPYRRNELKFYNTSIAIKTIQELFCGQMEWGAMIAWNAHRKYIGLVIIESDHSGIDIEAGISIFFPLHTIYANTRLSIHYFCDPWIAT